jgi:fluoride exporter
VTPEPEREPVPPEAVATSGVRRSVTSSDIALVAAGGAVGALLRVGLARSYPVGDAAFPWTTFVENITGAFGLGLLLTLLAERWGAHRWPRLLLCTGALGAFTTYSTFTMELGDRLLIGEVALAATYAGASLVGGLAAAVAGVRAARSCLRRGAEP